MPQKALVNLLLVFAKKTGDLFFTIIITSKFEESKSPQTNFEKKKQPLKKKQL
jgi:hypothetical protein